MGPLVYTSGNLCVGPVGLTWRDVAASMGPLVYTSGNLVKNLNFWLQQRASMGPLVYTSGNRRRRTP